MMTSSDWDLDWIRNQLRHTLRVWVFSKRITQWGRASLQRVAVPFKGGPDMKRSEGKCYLPASPQP
ncbi:rCG20311 [Rattus norvegicus]|uniref:RCG20311 n=1 Tax=Rattus norvegicus TaxID=10116 RepID=A6JH18_RAT|nr:rCG20311 [Rattus norvegicus]